MTVQNRASIKCILLGLLVFFSEACSLLNERIGPEVESCSDIQGPNVCEDDIIAKCVNNRILYDFCDEKGQPCTYINNTTGYRCGCVVDSDCKNDDLCSGGNCITKRPGPHLAFTRYQGEINIGKTTWLKVWIKNFGTSEAFDVKATLSSKDGNVTIINDTANYYTISPGQEVGSFGSSLMFGVSNNAKPGHKILFSFSISDKFKKNWLSTFTVTVN